MRREQEEGRGRGVADYGSGGWRFESLAARHQLLCDGQFVVTPEHVGYRSAFLGRC
jgi:hypothetical protein